MASTFSNVFSTEEIDSILNMSEVVDARNQLTNGKNTVDFTIHLSETMKQELLDHIGLDLQNVADVPCRWILGDTVAHADKPKDGNPFENTFLMYLTDSEGTLDVDGQSYPIAKGAAYVFSEGLMHGSSNNGSDPRLLLGPMNNMGAQVGENPSPTTISLDGSVSGENTIYIRQGEEIVEFSLDQDSWYGIYWPCTIYNTTNIMAFVSVIFTTDITLISADHYFIVGSAGIYFGDFALRPDGTRPVITVADTINYPGLVQNGTSTSNGHGFIAIMNLEIASRDSTLVDEGGWFAQAHYGGNAGPNVIINCFTSSPIPNNCGGIAGSYLAKDVGFFQIVGCYTTGTIGQNAGGIIGISAGELGGTVEIDRCFSTGLIGENAGGIAGIHCGGHNGQIRILNCYSNGMISFGGGGIVGKYCSTDDVEQYGRTEIYRCYSTGAIGEDAGGIVGSSPGGWDVRTNQQGYTVEVTNCFSTGAIASASYSGGIYGANFKSESQFAKYCYTSGLKIGDVTGGIYGGSASDVLTNSWNNYSEENTFGTGWRDITAKEVLIQPPTTTMFGEIWCQPDGNNTPYKLTYSAFSPYVISFFANDEIDETVTAGGRTTGPISSGHTYKLLQVNGLMPSEFPEINLNTETGKISTAISKETRTYEIYIYSTINPYSVTLLRLTVEGSTAKQCFANNLCAKGKKFVGGNRDASAVISAKTTKTLTNLKLVDPKQKSDAVNALNRQQALNRVRGGGYIVPKKVTGKYLQ